VGSKDITVNNEFLALNAPVVEFNGHSYIPLRFFLDWFGAEKINYDGKTEKVTFSLSRYENLDPDIKKKYRVKEPNNVVVNDIDGQEQNEDISVTKKPIDQVEQKNEFSEKEYQNFVLDLLRENFDSIANVGLDRYNKTFKITSTDENVILFVQMFFGIDNPSPELSEAWDKLVKSNVEFSKIITEKLPGYKTSFVNPVNTDKTLLIILDGVVIYNAAK